LENREARAEIFAERVELRLRARVARTGLEAAKHTKKEVQTATGRGGCRRPVDAESRVRVRFGRDARSRRKDETEIRSGNADDGRRSSEALHRMSENRASS